MSTPNTTVEIIPANTSISAFENFCLPVVIENAGKRAVQRFVEFFTAEIRNDYTRKAYGRAVGLFLSWCADRGLVLEAIEPVHVAAYFKVMQSTYSAPTVKQHLAGVRMMCDYLVRGGVLRYNPAAAVRGPRHAVKKGKTPVLTAGEARELLDSIDTSKVIGLRDRAMISVMLFSFARVGAVVSMKVEDYFHQGRRSFLRLHEKNSKVLDVPCHHLAVDYLDSYITAAGIGGDKKGLLFRAADRRGGKLTERSLNLRSALKMVKRRARAAGFDPDRVCCHTFRATGITTYLKNGGQIETAQAIAGHESEALATLHIQQRGLQPLPELFVGHLRNKVVDSRHFPRLRI